MIFDDELLLVFIGSDVVCCFDILKFLRLSLLSSIELLLMYEVLVIILEFL